MKTLLLQNMLHIPALGGANKCNRKLLEQLAAEGYRCRVVSPALGTYGFGSREEFLRALTAQDLAVISLSPDACVFLCAGVEVHAVFDSAILHRYVAEQVDDFQPDLTLVSSQDPGQRLLGAALGRDCGKLVYLLHAEWDLPFGPRAAFANPVGARLLRQCSGIITVSNYLKDYLLRWGGLNASVLRFPVYGRGPWPTFGNFGSGFVTILNPSAAKGIGLFVLLAQRFQNTLFAAVPTWATTSEDRKILGQLSNVRLLTPSENIDSIFSQTQILLVPSLVPEAFGVAVVEGMLRGIPVVASNAGALVEAKLGVDYVVPVSPIERYEAAFDEQRSPVPVMPNQDLAPWECAIAELLHRRETYERISSASRMAAFNFATRAGTKPFRDYFENLSRAPIPNPEFYSSPEKAVVGATATPQMETVSPARRSLIAMRVLKARKGTPPSV